MSRNCICTRNRPRELNAALESVFGCSRPPEQVIVGDDSDGESQVAVRAACRKTDSLQYRIGPRRGLAANRNSCLDLLKDDIGVVVFLDDDAETSKAFFALVNRWSSRAAVE
jgi:glycosyltransferase involved in cell wall biosynthesis